MYLYKEGFIYCLKINLSELLLMFLKLQIETVKTKNMQLQRRALN